MLKGSVEERMRLPKGSKGHILCHPAFFGKGGMVNPALYTFLSSCYAIAE
jgi:hypothetical protein